MEGKVSIIVPVYNVESYLNECIDSIINQTYRNLEIILIDDGSTDLSGEICDRYKEIDSRILVIHQKNQGAANAKNNGLDLATGDYISFVDSDDYISKVFIETMMKSLQQNNSDIAECIFYLKYKDSDKVEYFKNDNCIYDTESYLEQYILDWKSSLFWNKIFKSELIDNLRFKKERRCIDDEFFTYKAILKAHKISRINEPFYYYRQRKSSAINNQFNNKQKAQDNLDVLIERYNLITSQFPRLKESFINHDISMLYYILNSYNIDASFFKSLKKASKFYFKEAVISRCNLKIVYSILLFMFKKNINCEKMEDIASVNEFYD